MLEHLVSQLWSNVLQCFGWCFLRVRAVEEQLIINEQLRPVVHTSVLSLANACEKEQGKQKGYFSLASWCRCCTSAARNEIHVQLLPHLRAGHRALKKNLYIVGFFSKSEVNMFVSDLYRVKMLDHGGQTPATIPLRPPEEVRSIRPLNVPQKKVSGGKFHAGSSRGLGEVPSVSCRCTSLSSMAFVLFTKLLALIFVCTSFGIT